MQQLRFGTLRIASDDVFLLASSVSDLQPGGPDSHPKESEVFPQAEEFKYLGAGALELNPNRMFNVPRICSLKSSGRTSSLYPRLVTYG